ncbi:hypothetical protein GLOTRDRAFT_111644 [Gloeophyllum trabeum ATCC 11539]|uniref:DUF6533 domain-containing protein n=1 Tax=Gloeophyllum trabeum (strain ATCC 11539 / FP-39264 / Madison 617) TaxID=670483 RepID=S7RJ07_GLOTA|nr:uncharacterized protein GLOTRDRAFT_111644 [Gloeophyllum trabeum ATCC 11539]EPQ54345.1 hypothetical protein GLOTRDRAFT_111644 [Gloeophyllum trabeum ATCC 11539]
MGTVLDPSQWMAEVRELVTVLRNVQATRYLSAAGLVVLLWDHLLTFEDEVEFVWKAEWAVPKVLFLGLRYIVPVMLIINTYQMSGLVTHHLSDTVCKVWLSLAIYMGMISIAIGNFLVLLRLWILWDRKRALVYSTLLIFVLTQLAAIGTMTAMVVRLLPVLYFDELIDMCALGTKINVLWLWLPGIIFEVMVFTTVCWNAIDRPTSAHTPVMKALYRDGFGYFAALTLLRVFNLTLAIIAPVSLMFLGVFFIWSATNITVTRLILNSRKLSMLARKAEDDAQTDDMQDDSDDSVRLRRYSTEDGIRIVRVETRSCEEYELH